MVAGHYADIAYSQRGRSEKVGLKRKPVAVATAYLENRLASDVRQEMGERLGRHPHYSTLVVGYVYTVDFSGDRTGDFQIFARVGSSGRRYFSRNGKSVFKSFLKTVRFSGRHSRVS
jgi:hypothetical protein